MLDILNNVNSCIDHVPPVGTEYKFEVRTVDGGQGRERERKATSENEHQSY